jgi:fructose-bisphosphate aldolase, class II
VQHGASTLPPELFDRFPRLGTIEIHLATEFQSMLFDHPAFPAALKQEMYEKLRTLAADERKSGDTDEQFFYKTRKKALGPFKREMWGIPAAAREAISESLEKKFRFLLEKLGVQGTRAIAEKHAPFVPGSYPATAAMSPAHRAHEDVTGLHD